MHYLILADSFKGSLNAFEVTEHIARGIRESNPEAVITIQPMADGSALTTEILTKNLNGRIYKTKVKDPLNREVEAKYAVLPNKIGFMEVGAASGLHWMHPDDYNPMKANSFGAGQLLVKLMDEGCEELWIGTGGSAVLDGGAGMLKALGVRLLDKNYSAIPLGGGYLETITYIDLGGIDKRLFKSRIFVMCDVNHRLLGDYGTSHQSGAQKGATTEQILMLDQNLKKLRDMTFNYLSKDMDGFEYGGAGGGIASALHTFFDAHLVAGSVFFMDKVGIDEKIQAADVIITAEGKVDSHTRKGKTTFEVAQRASLWNKKVICVTGQVDPEMGIRDLPFFHSVYPIIDRPMKYQEAVQEAEILLTKAGYHISQMLGIAHR